MTHELPKGMILTGDTSMENFFSFRSRCDMPTLFVNIHPNKDFLAST
jgi:hypothetical protein